MAVLAWSPKRGYVVSDGMIIREAVRLLLNLGYFWHVAPAIKNDGERPIIVRGKMIVPSEAFVLSLDDLAHEYVEPLAKEMVGQLKGSCVFMSVPRAKDYAEYVENYDGVWLAMNTEMTPDGRIFSFETTARYIGEDDG